MDARGESYRFGIESITRGLKAIAEELHIPIVLLCQLSRLSERESREPQLSDLRETGAIEQDADVVIFTHFENFETKSGGKILVRKQRNGPLGRLDVEFLKGPVMFQEKELLPL